MFADRIELTVDCNKIVNLLSKLPPYTSIASVELAGVKDNDSLAVFDSSMEPVTSKPRAGFSKLKMPVFLSENPEEVKVVVATDSKYIKVDITNYGRAPRGKLSAEIVVNLVHSNVEGS